MENFEAASRVCLNLAQQAHLLTTFPERNPKWDVGRDVRKMTVDHYLIVYRIHAAKRQVEILRFWHGAQDQSRLRLKEEAGLYPTPLVPLATA
jgi:plasmid stabilization system protein ParE